MTIDIGNVLRVVAEWDAPDGTIAQLVWHYVVSAGSGGDPFDVLDDIIANLDAAWLNIVDYVDDDFTGAQITLFQRDTGLHRWDGVANASLLNVDGNLAQEFLAHGVSVLAKFFTEATRRQARKYLFGITEAHSTDGHTTVAGLVAFGLFAADFDDVVTSAPLTLVFGTYNVDPLSVLYESFSQAIQSVVVEGLYAYQRRRRPGTGI